MWCNPTVFPKDHLPWNREDWHRAEIPGAGGIATARSMARLYGCLANGGELDGVRVLSAGTIEVGKALAKRGIEPLSEEPLAFGVGFQLQTERREYGPPSEGFGTPAPGSSVHGAWPEHRVGLSYAMNSLRNDTERDPRAAALLSALYEAVLAQRARASHPPTHSTTGSIT